MGARELGSAFSLRMKTLTRYISWSRAAVSTSSLSVAPPLLLRLRPWIIWYTRTEDYGATYFKVPWNVNPQENSQNYGQNELVWRYDFLIKGDEEEL